MLTATLAATLLAGPAQVRVKDVAAFRQAAAAAKPGTTILLEPGPYHGGIHIQNMHGAPGKPIVIAASDPKRLPDFRGVGTVQFSDISYVEIRDISIDSPQHNGLNIDDGGTLDTPSHHVTLKNITVRRTPDGNNDGIKLSGLDDFKVENCLVEKWGGSAIDMVGCHKGLIVDSVFRQGGDTGIQCKGGTSQIVIRKNVFENAGQRSVNIGGSTGTPYFRPPIDKMPPNGRYEAKDITVEGCTFFGSMAPIAFVGVNGATVRFNTFSIPGRWAFRILQETNQPGFVPSRNGRFEDNLIIFTIQGWASGGVNIGPGTAPETFKFARNFWYCDGAPQRSKPALPTTEVGGVYGQDPMILIKAGALSVPAHSPGKNFGAHAFRQ